MTFTPDPELIERAQHPERGPDGRLRTLDFVEVSILRAPPFPARGEVRAELLARRAIAEDDLASSDRDLAALIDRRRDLVERIRGCNLALVGTGEVRDRETGETLQVLGRWHKRIPFVDPQPEPDGRSRPHGNRSMIVSGSRLRIEVVALLRASARPLALPEIERLLRLGGFVPAGRPSQTISNAMRSAIRHGRVAIVERGVYELTQPR